MGLVVTAPSPPPCLPSNGRQFSVQLSAFLIFQPVICFEPSSRQASSTSPAIMAMIGSWDGTPCSPGFENGQPAVAASNAKLIPKAESEGRA